MDNISSLCEIKKGKKLLMKRKIFDFTNSLRRVSLVSMYSAVSLPDQLNMEGLEVVSFHGYALRALCFIRTVVLFFIATVFRGNVFVTSNVYGSSWLEAVWSITPIFVLLVLTLPSVSLLYIIEGLYNPLLSVKATGHQWYWSYESSDFRGFNFDSYMETGSSLKPRDLRLLEVDNTLCLPYRTDVKVVTTSTDVIHSWALPAIGLKADAVPGRLNVLNIHSCKSGSYYGQCSEICGINHSFIPIHVEFVDWHSFLNHVASE